jgi:hypothetical protein
VHGLFHSRKEPWVDDVARPKWLSESLVEDNSVRVLVFSYQSVIDEGIIYTRAGIEKSAKNLLDAIAKHRTKEVEVGIPFNFFYFGEC